MQTILIMEKNYMKTNKEKCFFAFSIIFLVIIVALLFIKPDFFQQTTIHATSDAVKSIEYHEVSPEPKRTFWGLFWTIPGFTQQPQDNYNKVAGDELNITTKTFRPLQLTIHPHEKHSWYEKIGNDKWNELPNKGENLTIKIKKEFASKDLYYQAKFSYGNTLKNVFYSKVAHVHVSSSEIKTKSLDFNFLNTYLNSWDKNNIFNNTYAIPQQIPDSATGTVKWTLGEFQDKDKPKSNTNKLATIDSNGLITAKNQAEGWLSVTGYIINDDNSYVSKTKEIKIEGGLDDQNGRVNENATFQIITGYENTRKDSTDGTSIEWYKVAKKKDILVSTSQDSLYLTIKNLKESYDGNKYYAVIRNGDFSTKTRIATLRVSPPLNPTVVLDTKIKNITNDKETQDSNMLNHVSNGDEINYQTTITNNGERALKKSALTYDLDDHSSVKEITIDGKTIKEYQISSSNGHNQLIIPIPDLKTKEEHIVSISIKIDNVDDEQSFKFTPTVTGYYADLKQKYANEGKTITLNYTANRITAHFKNITFVPITAFENGSYKQRTSDTIAPNNVVSIQDDRRNKSVAKIYVKQSTDFKDSDGNILDANLFFLPPDSKTPQPLGDKYKIYESQKDQPMESIKWDKLHGLLLKVNKSIPKPGKYQATLTWNIENTI